jgi:hypothetical protein
MAEPALLELRHVAAVGVQNAARRVDRQSCQPKACTAADAKSTFAQYVRRPLARIAPVVIAALVAIALSVGWIYREEGHLSPESGLGYWLGIAGASAMLLLLLYPLRKRMKWLRAIGSVPFWFRFHMMLGVLGPVLIVFHSNFKLGALNSNVALFAMLIVAASGVVGRYFYGKIHMGLNGRKAAAQEILVDASQMSGLLDASLAVGGKIVDELNAFARDAMVPPRGAVSGMLKLLTLNARSRAKRWRLLGLAKAALAAEARQGRWSRRKLRMRNAEVQDLLMLYFAAVNKAAKFGFYERLFALWHVLHLPLFYLLIVAALVHILAVHMY